ncbi:hypothetical protein AX16_005810 [Volvariella volvacea WC 439]|nr:hypothetical protein AX16_005810 [Volvariella volvacea WC 439]
MSDLQHTDTLRPQASRNVPATPEDCRQDKEWCGAREITEVAPLPYTLVFNGKLQWNGTQEKAISRDYPFALANEALDQYVARNYLQVLWLPESIMPLNILVPLLRRVNAPSSLTSPHPLHDLLEPLLLTVAGVTNKYHNELPQILAAGEGAGEIEETMMWYALEYEKMGDQTDMSSVGNNPDHVGGSVWTNDKWREQYLQRMERREVQIQILLYMFKLSLPGPPPVPDAPSPKKRKRVPRQHQQDPENPIEDHLEAFMDKLSMWQLLGKLDAMASNASKDDRDWMQVFCEDIVEPQ